MIKIDPFVEINSPNKFGYWINRKNGQAYGGQYISPLLCPNLERVEKGFKKAIRNKKFLRGLEEQLLNYIGINHDLQDILSHISNILSKHGIFYADVVSDYDILNNWEEDTIILGIVDKFHMSQKKENNEMDLFKPFVNQYKFN